MSQITAFSKYLAGSVMVTFFTLTLFALLGMLVIQTKVAMVLALTWIGVVSILFCMNYVWLCIAFMCEVA